MVKTVVRALDASDEASRREWNQPLETFTVFGASKRGWTTWLTGAVDPRVTAIAPVVFDALNMAEHFPHQTAVFGAPSEAIKPYTDLGLPEILTSDRGAPLRQIVDPYSYLDALKQPKVIMLATNDAYFPSDSANLYWDALEGPKYLLYLPNEPHSIKHYGQAFGALRALQRSVTGGAPLPALEWEFAWNGDGAGGRLCVRSDPKPRARAALDREFRRARLSSCDLERGRRDERARSGEHRNRAAGEPAIAPWWPRSTTATGSARTRSRRISPCSQHRARPSPGRDRTAWPAYARLELPELKQ